ncbi:beta-ketoacyl-[acyl-carrier-protein] synthase family protein [Streptomyces sp. BV333]|uniref:beta-ketoacyl-[acyl-carrier-protein] synthase family protein n=1 Tax=Streptomyces sp. BV333 TaxID=2849673 RepID=UPI0027E04FBA|nr:beta-ketoacyl-[acyl-carrier-protein] synthase family protein [Streptomyces sp. BV333]
MVITGIGMVTPAGVGTATSWKTTCEGQPTGATDPRLTGAPVNFSCPVTGFDSDGLIGVEARRMDPFTQYALAAAREAYADAQLAGSQADPARIGVLLGTGVAGLGTWQEQGERLHTRGARTVNPLTIPKAIGNIAAATVSMEFGLHGPSLSLATACATGTSALGLALDQLRAGRCDVVLAGGTEATISPLVSVAFDQLKALSRRRDAPELASRPFDQDRDGFVLGEGAAVLVLERAAHARARGQSAYAEVLGYGESSDAHHLTAPRPDGQGAQLALGKALDDAAVRPSDVTLVNAHATSTPQGDGIEARVIERLFGQRAAVTSTKGVTGHMLGAAGAVEAAFTALSIKHGVVPPTANFQAAGAGTPEIDIVHGASRHTPVSVAVSNSFGFGGHNAVIVLGSVDT